MQKSIIIAVVVLTIVAIGFYFKVVKREKRYIYYIVEVKYKAKDRKINANRCYVSSISEIEWSNLKEEAEVMDKLQDKAMFQIRERVQALPECESIIQVIAPNYMTHTYQAASNNMYESLRDKESYYAENGDGKTETFNIQQ